MEPQQPTTHRTDPDDTEGHAWRHPDDTGSKTAGDVAGHGLTGGYRPTHPKATDDGDDVAGHLSGALGTQKKTEDAG